MRYEYALWKSGSEAERLKARLGKYQALKQAGRYAEAAPLIYRIQPAMAPSDIRESIVYEQVLAAYLNKDYPTALSRGLFGQAVFTDTVRNPVYDQYLLLMSLSAYQDDQWDTGYAYGLRYVQSAGQHDPLQLAGFDSLARACQPDLKKESVALWLSSLLPGTGQIYAGQTGDGLTSLGLHAMGLGAAVWAAVQGYWITAWLGAALVVQRIYMGGRERAVELVQKRNRLKKEACLQPVFQYLLSVTSHYPAT